MTAPPQHPERRGREERRAQVIAVARKLFLSKGFEQTSIKDITDKAGGSRRDIYDMFSDKDGLFEAVLQDLIKDILSPVELSFPRRPSDDISRDLNALGMALLTIILHPSSLAIFRQFLSIGAKRPAFGRQAFLSGPNTLYQKVEVYLQACVDENRLALDNIPATARVFVEMLKGDYQLKALMTGQTDFVQTEVVAHVENAVALFLNGARHRH